MTGAASSPCSGIDGDAGAGADVDEVAFDRERLRQHLDDLARDEHRAVGTFGRQQHCELVAAQPHDGVGPALQRLMQAVGDLAQQQVAHVVAERVVDLLEPVEIQGQHREPAMAALRAADRLREPVVEQRPVRQTGQRIRVRELADSALARGDAIRTCG